MEGIIDVERLWQWRTQCALRFQKRTNPFPCCSSIHLDFNVGSKKEKLDIQTLTNGAVVEICQFAKVVNKSKIHFVYEILDYNFDLGLERDEQIYEFAACTMQKLTAFKKKCGRKPALLLYDSFILPDPNTMKIRNYSKSYAKCQSSLKKNVGATYDCKNDLNVDTSSAILMETDAIQNSDKEESMRNFFPFCEEIGLVLDLISKPKLKGKLDLTLLTNGAMIEISNFAKSLCGVFGNIVHDVSEHNFYLSQKERNYFDAMKKVWKKGKKNNAFTEAVFSLPKTLGKPIDEGKTRTSPKCKGLKKDGDKLSKDNYMCPLEYGDLELWEKQPFSDSKSDKIAKNCSTTKVALVSDYMHESQNEDQLNETLPTQKVDLLSEEMDVNVGIDSVVNSFVSGQEKQIYSGSEECFQSATSSSYTLQTPPNVNNVLKTKSNRWSEIHKESLSMKRAIGGASVSSKPFKKVKNQHCKEIGLELSERPVNAKLDLQLLTRSYF